MNTKMISSLDGFQKSLYLSALDESRLGIGRVNKVVRCFGMAMNGFNHSCLSLVLIMDI